jgi:hypothetical protein
LQRIQALQESSAAAAHAEASVADARDSTDASQPPLSGVLGRQGAAASGQDWMAKLRERHDAVMAHVWATLPSDKSLSETVLPLRPGRPSEMRPDERVFPEHVDPADPEYRIGTFEDIGAQQQAAWCVSCFSFSCVQDGFLKAVAESHALGPM